GDFAQDLALENRAVRRLDEPVLVDPGEGRQRVDEADVRAFRRLDRADPAIVRRVNVTDFEARALAGETTRPERRNAALVRHFGERVGLVRELRELRRSEELAHRGDRGLGVYQVVRRHARHVDRTRALLRGARHAQQADAVLVLQQLAYRTHAAIVEVVDVVDLALAV